MALYAFDGTWNVDEEEPSEDTNIVIFRDIYAGPVEYRSGVGTRWGVIGRVLGGMLGFGGRTRIDEMYDELVENYRKGDHDIDIIGFSRGAALAVHFSNLIADKGIKLEGAERVIPDIRFLGIWDLVGSFGLNFNTLIDFQSINIGWKIDTVPNIVKHCFHAMALDERRETFNVTRLDADQTKPHVSEMWFRGNHSDIGGGNKNQKRSNIALVWMLEKSIECGLPIRQEDIQLIKRNCDNQAPFIAPKDLQRDKRRATFSTDQYHETATVRKLEMGQSHRFQVHAEHKWNWAGVMLEQGGTYQFNIDEGQKWMDGGINCGPEGWTTEQLPWHKEEIVGMFERRRRCPTANWFELVGALGDEDEHTFPIGCGGRDHKYRATKSAELFAFANDLDWKYENNKGQIAVEITRVE
jgi:hypothetical protein